MPAAAITSPVGYILLSEFEVRLRQESGANLGRKWFVSAALVGVRLKPFDEGTGLSLVTVAPVLFSVAFDFP